MTEADPYNGPKINLRLTKKAHANIVKVARAEHRSISGQIRFFIDLAYEAWEEDQAERAILEQKKEFARNNI